LNSVVRFARFLDFSDSALQKATELAEYGSKLADQFQYPGDPPFDDFYPAHLQYFNALSDNNRDEALAYFRERLDTLPEEEDKRLIAYVLVDLLVRVDRLDEAIEIAQEHLKDIDESIGFSFAELCQQAGRMDALREVSREKGDLVRYTAALLG
jgi:tetratricopeptide (TPR) repeat protein